MKKLVFAGLVMFVTILLMGTASQQQAVEIGPPGMGAPVVGEVV